jgi:eukaryotic-like serine/threonine-protein kinase
MVLANFVERQIARLKATPVDLAFLAKDGTPGSLLDGGAGVALFLYEVMRLRGDNDVLPLARRWCEVTRAWAVHAKPSQWHGMPDGFMIGEGGLLFVEALLAAEAGDCHGAALAARRIEQLAARHAESAGSTLRPTEYVGGAAGILSLIRELDARLPLNSEYAASRAPLERARACALGVLLARHKDPLAASPRDYLGFAHGIAGELWALAAALGADHAIVSERLAELAALHETDEDGLLYWRPSAESSSVELLGTWCNGMPGHALLWCEVARQTRSLESIELARKCAEAVGVLENAEPSLCCGHAGQAFALQQQAELSGDAIGAKQAHARLVSATRMVDAQGEVTPLALWQGGLGVALVAMARLSGETGIVCL